MRDRRRRDATTTTGISGVEAKVGKEVLGEFEHHVLLATVRLGEGAYSASIVEELGGAAERSDI